MSALVDFPVVGTSVPARRAASPSALTLLNQARNVLRTAEIEPDPGQRFAQAYLAALRGAAALLALRGRPHRGRSRPTSAWVLLDNLAPELGEWAAFFAAGSGTRAAVQSGINRGVSQRAADDLVRQSGQFLGLISEAVHEHAGTRP
jgi:hypothetical protein